MKDFKCNNCGTEFKNRDKCPKCKSENKKRLWCTAHIIKGYRYKNGFNVSQEQEGER
jgi:transposase-like protein